MSDNPPPRSIEDGASAADSIERDPAIRKGDRTGGSHGKIFKEERILKKLTREEMHKQCVREIRGTLIVAVLTCAWECIWAFALNGSGKMFLGMPAWLSVSVFGSIVVCLLGVWYLMKKVFIDFEYDEEVDDK